MAAFTPIKITIIASDYNNMITPDTRFTRSFTISSYDVDATRKASFQSICRYMQEIAALHAEHMGLGFHAMMKQGRAWVLAQMIISMEELPLYQEKITIKTWSNGPDGRFAIRDFLISNEKDKVIGKASSSWLVIDVEQKSICRLDDYFPGHLYQNIDYVLGRKPGRVKSLKEGEIKGSLEVKFSDLDINGHVNNVRYFDFIMDAFSHDFRMNHTM